MAGPSPLAGLGMTLSLPYNFAPDFVREVLEPFRDDTEEVYLPLFWATAGSGRTWKGPGSQRDYLKAVDALAEAAAGLGIRLNFVANIEGGPRDERLAFDEIERLADRFPGAGFTVASLPLAASLKAARPGLEIGPSTLSDVTSALVAAYWKRAVNPSVMTVAREVNRRPAVLRQMKALGFRVKVVARDGCVPDCPLRSQHFDLLQRCNEVAEFEQQPHPVRCRPWIRQMKQDPDWAWIVALNAILPGNLRHLAGIVDIVKLEGRDKETSVVRRQVEYYRAAESLEYIDAEVVLREPPEAWERLANCDRSCTLCRWCRDHIVPAELPRAVGAAASPPRARSDHHVLRIVSGEPSGPLSVEVFGLEEGRPFFLSSRRFGVAYRGTADGPLPDALRDRLQALADELAARESDPRFDLRDPALADFAARTWTGCRVQVVDATSGA